MGLVCVNGGQSAQLHHVGHDALRLFIDRHEAFGMEFAQGHMERHLLITEPLEAIPGEGDTFTDADSCGPHEAESVGLQGVGKTELLLQMSILVERKRSGEIVVAGRKILTTNEVGSYRMPLVG